MNPGKSITVSANKLMNDGEIMNLYRLKTTKLYKAAEGRVSTHS